MMKLSTFNPNLIRQYIEGTDVLEKGIAYMKQLDPSVSDAVAKESAIRMAQEYCQRKWQNDSTGYISSEYVAYTEFAKDVQKGFYFSAPRTYSSSGSGSDRDWFLFIICLLFGYLGIHRFIDGRKFTGFLWLCTGGFFLIGWIVDCVRIWKGDF